ncbi:hypothetical protein NDU88_005578 [Pleurodeles waltl]|uniref:Uncharacterized protein n=1 Tax=Pleurodeles waltl TaxID=8319 RepID=A0AAV7WD38_PLEWA|nr:hypothetical protein NDU88_005578 [Pleurodeles waltl]
MEARPQWIANRVPGACRSADTLLLSGGGDRDSPRRQRLQQLKTGLTASALGSAAGEPSHSRWACIGPRADVLQIGRKPREGEEWPSGVRPVTGNPLLCSARGKRVQIRMGSLNGDHSGQTAKSLERGRICRLEATNIQPRGQWTPWPLDFVADCQ